MKFRDIVSTLIYDWHWTWLELLICTLCDLEVRIPLLFDSEFRYQIGRADTRQISPVKEDKTPAERMIPDDLLYCEDCPFRTFSKIANFCFGEMSSGYCYYLDRGDYGFVRHTDLIWDGCKECGIHEDRSNG